MMPLPGLPSMTSSTARMLWSAEAWATGGLAARVQGWRPRPLVRTWTSRQPAEVRAASSWASVTAWGRAAFVCQVAGG
eukprot:5975968-Alexandrium_andersonii.AAC.1